MGMEGGGLIDNFNSATDNLTFLSSTAARANIIQQLMEQARLEKVRLHLVI